jgi:hypothetical protein
VAPCSRVGHVFRYRRPYSSPNNTDTDLRNTLRAMRVWIDGQEYVVCRKNPYGFQPSHRMPCTQLGRHFAHSPRRTSATWTSANNCGTHSDVNHSIGTSTKCIRSCCTNYSRQRVIKKTKPNCDRVIFMPVLYVTVVIMVTTSPAHRHTRRTVSLPLLLPASEYVDTHRLITPYHTRVAPVYDEQSAERHSRCRPATIVYLH